jgi:hypothetical protein
MAHSLSRRMIHRTGKQRFLDYRRATVVLRYLSVSEGGVEVCVWKESLQRPWRTH